MTYVLTRQTLFESQASTFWFPDSVGRWVFQHLSGAMLSCRLRALGKMTRSRLLYTRLILTWPLPMALAMMVILTSQGSSSSSRGPLADRVRVIALWGFQVSSCLLIAWSVRSSRRSLFLCLLRSGLSHCGFGIYFALDALGENLNGFKWVWVVLFVYFGTIFCLYLVLVVFQLRALGRQFRIPPVEELPLDVPGPSTI